MKMVKKKYKRKILFIENYDGLLGRGQRAEGISTLSTF